MYKTTPRRVIISTIAGAGLGAAITSGRYLWGLYEINGPDHFSQYGYSKGTSVFYLAFFVWLIGISLFGGPVWYWLHRNGRRQLRIAILAGAATSFVAIFAIRTRAFTGRAFGNYSYEGGGGRQWDNGVLTDFGWLMALQAALSYSFYGLLIGALIWCLAYRRS